ncbi:MAG: methyltransferase [Candidatus Atribacteria bacterium]|nr:methyltransferase [Candidatus Atribacteria bacterium]
MTSRERVIKTLTFQHPDRSPRDLWWLPAVEMTQPRELQALLEQFPMDFSVPRFRAGLSERQKGQPTIIVPGSHTPITLPREGKYMDEWGSIWYIGEDGLIGEVKEPVLDDLSKIEHFSPPWEYLESTDLSEVNQSCAETDRFVLSDICARPFERMQFLCGTEKFFIDLAYGTKGIFQLRDMVHEFNLRHLNMWLNTDVDGINMMDDWGTQNSTLISPDIWRSFFKPLYKEYCDLVHSHNKYVFFHSDGWIESLYPELVEIGVDAMNSQLFIMNIEKIADNFRGKITFWGEIDRRLLYFGKPEEIKTAVLRVRKALEDPRGGIIAQCEWGKDNPPENLKVVFDTWNIPPEDIL